MKFHIAWFQIFLAALQAFLAQAGTTTTQAVQGARAAADEAMGHLHPDLIENPEFNRHGQPIPPGSTQAEPIGVTRDTPQTATDRGWAPSSTEIADAQEQGKEQQQ